MTDMLIDNDARRVSRQVFVSPEIYRQEMETIFARSWLFVGHVDQVRKPGDFFLSRMGEDSVILNRDSAGKVHVFLNTCRHRGMRVCRYDQGNTAEFHCPYHGWTYSNDGSLAGVPQFREGYGAKLDKSAWGLIEAPHVKDFAGTIWATWDPNAPAFDDWLSDMRTFLGDFLALPDASGGEWECVGGVMKWTIPCNWKWGADNFIGDNYHNVSHASVDVVELSPSGRKGRHQGDVLMEAVLPTSTGHKVQLASEKIAHKGTLLNISTPRWGHGARGMLWEDDYPYVSQWGRFPAAERYFEEAYEKRRQRLGVRSRFHGHGGTIFPNFSWSTGRCSLAVWHPRGPDSTEVWRWTLVPKDAPAEVKDAMYHYAMTYQGPSGLTEQDDMENWNYGHEGCASPRARMFPFNYELGSEPDSKLLADWGLRESRVGAGISEINQRGYFTHWNDRMAASRGNGGNGGAR